MQWRKHNTKQQQWNARTMAASVIILTSLCKYRNDSNYNRKLYKKYEPEVVQTFGACKLKNQLS